MTSPIEAEAIWGRTMKKRKPDLLVVLAVVVSLGVVLTGYAQQ